MRDEKEWCIFAGIDEWLVDICKNDLSVTERAHRFILYIKAETLRWAAEQANNTAEGHGCEMTGCVTDKLIAEAEKFESRIRELETNK